MLSTKGGVPEFIDFWNIIVRMGAILEAISLRILAGMLSGPWALFGFNSFSNFSMPLTAIWIGGICGDRFWLGSWGMLVRFSLVLIVSQTRYFKMYNHCMQRRFYTIPRLRHLNYKINYNRKQKTYDIFLI